MDNDGFESKLSNISAIIFREWEARVCHDYLYWAANGAKSDEDMWKSAKRDFDLLSQNLGNGTFSDKKALEIGCGVGRLLRPASKTFKHITGLDISLTAINRAKTFLSDCHNVDLLEGNAADLPTINDAEIDLAYSFDVITRMPTAIFAGTLTALSRAIKNDGLALLHLYMGSSVHNTVMQDTMAVRSYSVGSLKDACEAAGFALLSIRGIPFAPDDAITEEQNNSAPYIVVLRRTGAPSAKPYAIERLLNTGFEQEAPLDWPGSRTQYLMCIARATEHMEAKHFKLAQETLEFALANYTAPETSTLEILKRLRSSNAASLNLSPTIATPQPPSLSSSSTISLHSQVFKNNLTALEQRFPAIASILAHLTAAEAVSARQNSKGDTVIFSGTTPLDQMENPKRAAEVWAERTLNSADAQSAEQILIMGFATGYHLDALASRSSKALHVVEPNPNVLCAIMQARDCRHIITRLSSLSISLDNFKNAIDTYPELRFAYLALHPQTQVMEGETIREFRRHWLSERAWKELRPSIAVVGPLYGGSLPIARYIAHALLASGQRVQYFDLQAFHRGYTHIRQLVNKRHRVNLLENKYVEMLSDFVVEATNEHPIDILICVAQAPLSARALSEFRKRGIITAMWFVEDCDRFTTWQQISRYYDYMFLIQDGEYLKRVKAAGAAHAFYLPVGCSPLVHKPLSLTPDEVTRWGSDISFVGAGYNNRQQVFSRFPSSNFKIWGTEWPSGRPFDRLVQEKGRRLEPEEYVKIFNASKININLHSSNERDGIEPFGNFVNPRTFELASCGAFQLVDNRSLLPELFKADYEVATFSTLKELSEKIDYYLNHPEERQRMASAARKRALECHTYEHRMRSLLGHIYADNFEFFRAKQQSGAWPGLMRAAVKFPELSKRVNDAYQQGREPKLDSLIVDIQTSNGALSETEQKLLFLHHVRQHTTYVNKLREGE